MRLDYETPVYGLQPMISRASGRMMVGMLVLVATVAGAMSVSGCRFAGNRGGEKARMRVESAPASDGRGGLNTVLRIVCDCPDDVESVARTVAGRIN